MHIYAHMSLKFMRQQKHVKTLLACKIYMIVVYPRRSSKKIERHKTTKSSSSDFFHKLLFFQEQGNQIHFISF